MIIQLTGLPASGKTSIATVVAAGLAARHIPVKVIDGDEFRRQFASDLGFSENDRYENIRRMGRYAKELEKENKVVIMAAINPFEKIRHELKEHFEAMVVYISCERDVLLQRDPKGLYARALLPADHPQYLANFTGISSPYDVPADPDLIIYSGKESLEHSSAKLTEFILMKLQRSE